MSRASNGTYTLPAGNPVVTNTVISSTWANTTLSDLATEMTDSLDRSGKGSMLAGLPLADGVIGAPGLAFGTELTLGMYRTGAGAFAFVSGGINRLALASTGAWTLTGPTTANTALTINVTQAGAVSGILLLGTDANFIQPFMVRNLSAANTAINYGVEIANDTAGKELYFFNTSTTYAASVIPNIPAGAACGIAALNNQFAVGVGGANTCQLLINGTTNFVKIYEAVDNIGAAGLMFAATYESGSFTGTLVGCTTSPTTTCTWRRVGPVITVDIAPVSATSNATTASISGIPAAMSPARVQRGACPIVDNSVNEAGFIGIAAGGTSFLLSKGTLGLFAAANTKGTSSNVTFTYNLT